MLIERITSFQSNAVRILHDSRQAFVSCDFCSFRRRKFSEPEAHQRIIIIILFPKMFDLVSEKAERIRAVRDKKVFEIRRPFVRLHVPRSHLRSDTVGTERRSYP